MFVRSPLRSQIKQAPDFALPFLLHLFSTKMCEVGLKLLLSFGMSHSSMNIIIPNDDTVSFLIDLLPSLVGVIIGTLMVIVPPILFNLFELVESSKLGVVVER